MQTQFTNDELRQIVSNITIDILKRNPDKTFEVINPKDVVVGDYFIAGHDKENKPIIKQVSVIHEQRAGRGKYLDETKRPMWAKIS